MIAFFRDKLRAGCGVLCFEEDVPLLQGFGDKEKVIPFGKRDDLSAQAHLLFAALRRFDKMKVAHIFARHTAKNDLGLAISNRLLRACAFDILELEGES